MIHLEKQCRTDENIKTTENLTKTFINIKNENQKQSGVENSLSNDEMQTSFEDFVSDETLSEQDVAQNIVKGFFQNIHMQEM
jgi:hypothetical protein